MRLSILAFCLLAAPGLAGAAAVAPAITVQPVNSTVLVPTAATFTVTATGTAPLTYQWWLSTNGGANFTPLPNGGGYSGTMTRSLRVSPSALGQSGQQFRCVVTNGQGSVTSNAVVLTVNQRPTITTQPVSKLVLLGGSVTFTVTATGTPALSYQWKKNGVAIAGQTTPSLTFPNVATGDAASYTVTIANTFGTVTSTAAKLTIGTGPTVSVQPASVGVVAPTAATFTVTATGTATLLYQWQSSTDGGANFNPLTNGGGFAGVTTRSLRVSPSALGMNGTLLRCMVTNSLGSVTSNPATLTVGQRPAITTQPASKLALPGDAVTFSVTATGTPLLTYQWKKNGAIIPGQTNPAFTLPNAATGDVASYTVTVANGVGTVTSAPAKLTLGTVPAITVQPASKGVVAPTAAVFTVTATGTATLLYQWESSTDGGANFNPLTNGGGYSGVTTRSLRVSPSALGMNGTLLRCVVTNTLGGATSNPATLTVGQLPTITAQPLPKSVLQGDPVTFAVTATGTGPLSYQWKKNNVAIAGQTGSSFTIPAVAGPDGASYTVTVTNPLGSVTSKAAKLTVATAPVITFQPQSLNLVAPITAVFRVTATGTGPLSYQWQRSTDGGATFNNLANGPGITGATTGTLTLRSSNADYTGNLFRCVVTNAVGTANSNPATLTVNIRPAIITQPLTQGMPLGGTGSLTVVANGTLLTYQWKKNGVAIPGETTATLNFPLVSAATAGNYSVTISNPVATITSRTAVVTVGIPPTITVQPVNDTVWGIASFTAAATGAATIKYQWQISTNGGANFTNLPNSTTITGAATETLLILPVAASLNGNQFRCVATNNFGTAVTNAATLTVQPLPAPPFNWTVQNPSASIPLAFTQFTSVAQNSTTFVAVGGDTRASNTTGVTRPLVEVSPNGSTWTLASNAASLGVTGLRAVAWGANRFVAAGDGGLLMTSANGTTWGTRPSSTTFSINNIVWTGAQFTAICFNPNLNTAQASGGTLGSQDGLTWNVRATFATLAPFGFARCPNPAMNVAVGARVDFANQTLSGGIMSSPDGINWTVRDPLVGGLPLSTQFNSIAYGGPPNNVFVTVGTNGVIYTSPNGVTWTSRNSGTVQNLNYVTTVGSYFLIVGGGSSASPPSPTVSTVLISSNGLTWTSVGPAPAGVQALNGVTWSETGVLLVGAGGSILTGLPAFPGPAPAAFEGDKPGGDSLTTTAEPESAVSAPVFGAGENLGTAVGGYLLQPGALLQIIHGQAYATISSVDEPEAVIAGTVRDAAGEPVAGATVYACTTIAGLRIAACVETDADGTFRLGVLAGEWSVGTDTDLGAGETTVKLAAGDEVSADLILP